MGFMPAIELNKLIN